MEFSLPHLFENLFTPFSLIASEPGSLHPLIVHFPIALFMVAPLFIIGGLIRPNYTHSYLSGAAVLMMIALLFTLAAFKTGELASSAITSGNETIETLGEHAELAEMSRLVFFILTVIFAGYRLWLSSLEKKFSRRMHFGFLVVFLLAYGYGLLLLTSTAHYGGKLVHHHGIHSPLFDKEQP